MYTPFLVQGYTQYMGVPTLMHMFISVPMYMSVSLSSVQVYGHGHSHKYYCMLTYVGICPHFQVYILSMCMVCLYMTTQTLAFKYADA